MNNLGVRPFGTNLYWFRKVNIFFKQKTAYEIGVRLVGSEMCIRDSLKPHHKIISPQNNFFRTIFRHKNVPEPTCRPQISPEADFLNFFKSLQQVRTANASEIPVSYTHLTLPTTPYV